MYWLTENAIEDIYQSDPKKAIQIEHPVPIVRCPHFPPISLDITQPFENIKVEDVRMEQWTKDGIRRVLIGQCSCGKVYYHEYIA